MAIRSRWIAAVAAGLVLAGCGSQQEPATQAVEAAKSAIDAVRDEAAQYAPDQLKAVDEALGRIQKQLADKNFADVLTAAPVVTNQVNELKTAVTEGKARAEAAIAEAKDMWPRLAEELPKMSAALKTRLDALAKMKKLPQGMDTAGLEASRQAYDEMSKDWAAAQEDFTAGRFTDAASKANAARRRGADLMARLQVPAQAG
ncbi:MAG: hypothetical protein MUF07_09070 [Steroidobacteraceae bacterium]|jgi:hypothetical protein|nr:hypothetical protein [Steroidobacteraceae bacterium]